MLLSLIEVARRAGVRISPAETLDAQRAAMAIGLEHRQDLRAALAATLVKREDERPAFDRAFDAFFAPTDVFAAGADIDERERAELLRRIEAAGGSSLIALMQGGAELERRIDAAMREAEVDEMQSPMQVGLYSLRALERLGVPEMQRELGSVRADLGSDSDALADSLAHSIDALRRHVRARVRENFERKNPERLRRHRAERLEREALSALSKDEVDQMSIEVARLGRLLRDRMERERRRARRGRLDVRATVRASMRTGGVPFAPVFRRRRRDRPKLVVLCDVSDSVRAAARFLLMLVYTMHEAFARTRSFVFVRELGEATPLFETYSPEEAIHRAFAGDVVSVAANSDYGHVLEQLVAQHLDAIDRRTTILILGDARTNYLDPRLDALAAIQRRAARIVWLNPEPRASWGFGDSEMKRYLHFCTFAASVRSLAELRAAVERLATVVTR